jgi:hypothetical protein
VQTAAIQIGNVRPASIVAQKTADGAAAVDSKSGNEWDVPSVEQQKQ